ncbi:hypothetical protein J6590_068510 [Homalodisca vitripennis]|nr:hypothetical protein J6590_068510 [Homalodisca vitripennis]
MDAYLIKKVQKVQEPHRGSLTLNTASRKELLTPSPHSQVGNTEDIANPLERGSPGVETAGQHLPDHEEEKKEGKFPQMSEHTGGDGGSDSSTEKHQPGGEGRCLHTYNQPSKRPPTGSRGRPLMWFPAPDFTVIKKEGRRTGGDGHRNLVQGRQEEVQEELPPQQLKHQAGKRDEKNTPEKFPQ